MLMASLTRRLQVLVEDDRFEQLERLAGERSTTVAALVREALDRAFPSHRIPHQSAAERFLARPPVDFGEWDTLKSEIEQSFERHLPG